MAISIKSTNYSGLIMKKSILFLLFFILPQTSNAFEWGSSFDEADFEIGQNTFVFHERDDDPSTPLTNEVKFYAKDNSGTTKFYMKDSADTVTEIGAGGGAPTDAKYITQTTNGTLTGEQALSSLATGIMKVTTTTGVISSLTDSSGLLGEISDETGTGVMVAANSPTFVDSIQLGSNGTDGQLVIYNELGTTDFSITIDSSASQTEATTYTLPPDNGDSGEFLTTDGDGILTWETAAVASVAGSDTQVQFNDGGTAFGGDAGLVYNKTTDALTAGSFVSLGTTSQITGESAQFINFDTVDVIYFGQTGGTHNEDLGLNVDTAANTITLVTTTGTNIIDTVAIGVNLEDATLEIPNDTTGTVSADGQIKLETDEDGINIQAGSNATGGIPTNTDVKIPLMYQKDVTLIEPDQIQTVMDAPTIFTVDSYNYPGGITIKAIRLTTDASSTCSYNIEEWTTPTDGAPATIDAIATSTSSEVTETTITDGSVAVGGYVKVDLDTCDVNEAHITVYYYANI